MWSTRACSISRSVRGAAVPRKSNRYGSLNTAVAISESPEGSAPAKLVTAMPFPLVQLSVNLQRQHIAAPPLLASSAGVPQTGFRVLDLVQEYRVVEPRQLCSNLLHNSAVGPCGGEGSHVLQVAGGQALAYRGRRRAGRETGGRSPWLPNLRDSGAPGSPGPRPSTAAPAPHSPRMRSLISATRSCVALRQSRLGGRCRERGVRSLPAACVPFVCASRPCRHSSDSSKRIMPG